MANTPIQVLRTSTAGKTPNTSASYTTNSAFIGAGGLALNMTDAVLYSTNGTSGNLITIGQNSFTYNASNGSVSGFTANSLGITVASANIIANTAGIFVANTTGVVNAATIQASATFTANSTLVNAAAINVTGNINTATINATSGNVSLNGLIISNTGGAFDFNKASIQDFHGTINTQTASYTLANTDTGKIVEISNSTAATTVTLANTLPAGFNCMVVQIGTSNVTFSNAAGTTFRKSATGANCRAQYSMVTIYVRANAGAAADIVLGGDAA